MKILLLAPGESIHSRRFLQMLLDRGHQVTLVDFHDPIPQGCLSYRFIAYPKPFKQLSGKYRSLRYFASWVERMKLKHIWKMVKPDIVHVHWIDGRAEQCGKAGLHPLILTCWGSDINNLFESKCQDEHYLHQTITALSCADYITADTNQVLERCNTLVGKELKSGLFYFGIDFNRFHPNIPSKEVIIFKENFNIPLNAKIILSIRRLVPMLGHEHILRAFSSLISQINDEFVLIFHHYLGKNSAYEYKLKKLADNLGISQNIIWLEGIRDDQMPELYSSADLIINFPDYDGLPVSLFEAAACKKMIVTNNLIAYKEILEKSNFTVVPVGDTSQLASAMKTVFLTPDSLKNKQVEENYEYILQIADQRKCVSKLEKVYIDLISHEKHG